MIEPDISSVYYFQVNSKAIFLHPFRNRKYFLNVEKGHVVNGYYGENFDYTVLPVFREELELLLKAHLKAWNEERTFLASFLLASLAFLLIFIFMSIGIRDPIPLLDEILVSTGVAVVVFIAITRKMFTSDAVTNRKLAIQSSFDAISFAPLPVLKEADAILKAYETIIDEGDEAKILKLLTEPDKKHNFDNLREEEGLVKSLEVFFSAKEYRNFKKSPNKLILFLRQEWYHIKELKLPLYLLYVQLTR